MISRSCFHINFLPTKDRTGLPQYRSLDFQQQQEPSFGMETSNHGKAQLSVFKHVTQSTGALNLYLKDCPTRHFAIAGEGSSGAGSPAPSDPVADRYVPYPFKTEMLAYLKDLGGDIAGLEHSDGEKIAEMIFQRKQATGKRYGPGPSGKSYPLDEAGQPIIRNDGVDLEKCSSALSWLAKTTKDGILLLLQNNGEDITGLLGLNGPDLAEYMVERWKRLHPDSEATTDKDVGNNTSVAYSEEHARTYLLAIKRQALLDPKANAHDHRNAHNHPDSTRNEENESKKLFRVVVLHDNTGTVLFSYRLQALVRTLLKHCRFICDAGERLPSRLARKRLPNARRMYNN
jgi:hypothetical protein